jgi:hypothetical protein
MHLASDFVDLGGRSADLSNHESLPDLLVAFFDIQKQIQHVILVYEHLAAYFATIYSESSPV